VIDVQFLGEVLVLIGWIVVIRSDRFVA